MVEIRLEDIVVDVFFFCLDVSNSLCFGIVQPHVGLSFVNDFPEVHSKGFRVPVSELIRSVNEVSNLGLVSCDLGEGENSVVFPCNGVHFVQLFVLQPWD